MIEIEKLKKGYDYFFYKKNNYFQKLLERDKKTLQKFLSAMKENSIYVGYGFLYRYLVFQFAYWDELETATGTIQFNQVFGDKAFTRYLQRDQEFDWLLENHSIQKKYDTNSQYFAEYIEPIKKVKHKDPESVRVIAIKQTHPLLFCINLTSLYNPSSTYCNQCSSQEHCKIVKSKQHEINH